MNHLIRVVGLVSVVSLLSGCGLEGDRGSSQQALRQVCAQGTVPWDFYRFRNGLDDQSLSLLGPDAGTGDERVGEPNYIELLSATCNRPLDGGFADVTEQVKAFAPRGRREFMFTEAVRKKFSEPQGCGGVMPTVSYSCHQDGIVRKDVLWTSALCPSQERQLIGCVPENCYGRTRRDSTLQCVPDVIKPVEAKDTLVVNFTSIARPLIDPTRASTDAYSTGSDGAAVITLDHGQIYRFRGSVDVATGPAPRQLVSLWVKSTVARPGSTTADLDIFRCFLGRFDLRKYTPTAKAGGGQTVAFDEVFRVPTECENGENFGKAVKTAWLALGLNVDAGTASLPTSAAKTVLMASYDLEAKAIVTKGAVPIESTCVPKPFDFFYNYDTRVHNGFDFYNQLTISVAHTARAPNQTPRLEFNPVPSTLIATTQVEVPLLEYKVNKAGRARGSIDSALVVAMSGPEAKAWSDFMRAYTSYANPLFWDEFPVPKNHPFNGIDAVSRGRRVSFDTPTVGNEQYATALIPVPDVNALGDDGKPRLDYSALIRLPAEALGLSLEGPMSETGTGATLSVKINNTIRSALYAPGGRYPLVPGGTRNYVLQVCAQGTVYEDFEITRTIYSNDGSTKNVEEFKRRKRVALATGGTGKSAWDATALADGQASTLKVATNGCARSAVFSFYGENVVTPLPEVEVGDGDASDLNPTSSGDDSRLSGTFNSDTTQDCVGNRCETTTEQSFGGSDSPAKSTVLSIVAEEEEEDATGEFRTTFKMFGFDVLDAVENNAVGPVETSIVISPKYEEIAKSFNKPYPGFKIESGRVAASVNGLSVGFEYKVPIRYGPIQGDLIFGVSAGAGMNIEVTHTHNPKVASSCAVVVADGGTLPDSCPDPVLAMPALPFRAARDFCLNLGGRLTEPRSAAVVTSMRGKIPASEEVWIAAQVGNEYKDNSDCAAAWNSSICSTGHKTYLRWLSDAENFRVSTSFGGFVNAGTNPITTIGGTAITTDTLAAQPPVDSAVTLQNATLRVRPMNSSYRSLCQRPLISSGKSNALGIKLNVGAAAGFSVAFCTPSDEFGLCLEGSINLVETKLSPGVSVIHTSVSNSAGQKASQTKFGAKVDWSVNLMSGSLDIKLVTPFVDTSYTLLGYDGFNVGQGTLAEFEYDFADFPAGFK